MHNEYVVRPCLEAASLHDYAELFSESFPNQSKLSIDYLQWLYCQNPSGAVVGMDAFFGGKLVAHYATVPMPYGLHNHDFSALLSLNTATHPRHQRKGLFKRLARATYEQAVSLKYDFVIGAANENSTHGFVNGLGFLHLGNISMSIWSDVSRPSIEMLARKCDAQWIRWRLERPNAQYTLHRIGSTEVCVQSKYRGLPLNLGRLSLQTLDAANLSSLVRVHSRLPGLTPLFISGARQVNLPRWLHPSPWNIIFLPLSPKAHGLMPGQMYYDGLAMDTF